MTNPRQTTPSGVGGGRGWPSGRWSAQRARQEPSQWATIRDRVDLADVARRLLGEPPGRKGERGKRLWWHCPFHHPDDNPSFCIVPDGSRWRCFGCNEHGDAVALVQRCRRCTFREAVAFIASDV